ncbi:MAG: hypothetical protein B7X06_02145, partial [Verrucomicrobia bacterium 21-51-4]
MSSDKSTETSQNVRVYTSPAKVNLFLAVCGVREDGFHSLISLGAPLAFGDRLEIALDATSSAPDSLRVHGGCDIPVDSTNLVLRAVAAFRQRVPTLGSAHIELFKEIPSGAGLGGGSSNAATVLQALNAQMGQALSAQQLHELGMTLGSDVPLFMEAVPQKMWGRGEFLSPVASTLAQRLCGRRLL